MKHTISFLNLSLFSTPSAFPTLFIHTPAMPGSSLARISAVVAYLVSNNEAAEIGLARLVYTSSLVAINDHRHQQTLIKRSLRSRTNEHWNPSS